MVTWCRLSGDRLQKSHIIVAVFRFVCGSRFCVWIKSENLRASRINNTGGLLAPQPLHTPRVEKGRNNGVCLPTFSNSFAVVYFGMSGLVTVRVPYAPEPLAWTTRSGTPSRLKG